MGMSTFLGVEFTGVSGSSVSVRFHSLGVGSSDSSDSSDVSGSSLGVGSSDSFDVSGSSLGVVRTHLMGMSTFLSVSSTDVRAHLIVRSFDVSNSLGVGTTSRSVAISAVASTA